VSPRSFPPKRSSKNLVDAETLASANALRCRDLFISETHVRLHYNGFFTCQPLATDVFYPMISHSINLWQSCRTDKKTSQPQGDMQESSRYDDCSEELIREGKLTQHIAPRRSGCRNWRSFSTAFGKPLKVSVRARGETETPFYNTCGLGKHLITAGR
jgi:hypothetical protein